MTAEADQFAVMLTVGGRSNSLGRAEEVVTLVLQDAARLEELYACLSHQDAWVRMRAADALEKVCRQRPGWLAPYIDRLQADFSDHPQASIRWHLAQIYRQVELTASQKQRAVVWLERLLSGTDVDWIVAANAMDTLVRFTLDGSVAKDETVHLLRIQQQHASKSVVRKAAAFLAEVQA